MRTVELVNVAGATCALFVFLGLLEGCPMVRPPPPPRCVDTCESAGNGACEDGRAGSTGTGCAAGTDCLDCGPATDLPEPELDDPSLAEGGPVGAPRPVLDFPRGCNAAGDIEQYTCEDGAPVIISCRCSADGTGCYAAPYACPYSTYDGSRAVCMNSGPMGFGCYWPEGGTSPTFERCRVARECPDGTELLTCATLQTFSTPHLGRCGFRDASCCSARLRHETEVYECGACGDACNVPLPPDGSCTLGDACGGCPTGSTCVESTCVGEGALRFTLAWSATVDLDLHVLTPGGTEISYTRRSADSGMLDRDNTAGGSGALENVFFSAPPTGTYTYWAYNFSASSSASFTLRVYRGGALAATQTGTIGSRAESSRFTIDFP